MKILERIRSLYKDQELSFQEKAVSLVILDAVLFIGFLALGILRILGGSSIMGVLELVVSVLVLLLLFAILKKHYKLASTGNIVLFCCAAAGLFFIRDITGAKDIYIQSTYMIPVFIIAPLLAYSTWQVFTILIFGFAALTGQFFFRVVPAVMKTGGIPEKADFYVALIMMIFTGIFAYQLFIMQRRSLRIINSKEKSAGGRFTKLRSIIANTADAFSVGERLQEHAGRNTSMAGTISEELAGIQENIEKLLQSIASAARASENMSASQNSVKSTQDRQIDAINTASAAIEEISAQVQSMSSAAKQKEDTIQELVQASSRGEDKLDESLEFFRDLENSSENLIEVINVIEGIAGRTNLLAMNAAIEAAHAGDAGKGFAVVAEEIRKLAEETNENSRVIRSTLEENLDKIKGSVQGTEDLRAAFREIASKITNVRNALLELIAGMEELQQGQNDIRSSISNLSGISEEVETAISEMEKSTQSGDSNNEIENFGLRAEEN